MEKLEWSHLLFQIAAIDQVGRQPFFAHGVADFVDLPTQWNHFAHVNFVGVIDRFLTALFGLLDRLFQLKENR